MVVGNGPSVAALPPAAWADFKQQGKLIVGTNRVLAVACLQSVQWDALVMRDCYRQLWANQDVGWRYDRELWQHHPAWRVGPAEDRASHCDEFVLQVPGWQPRDVRVGGESCVMANASVVIMACNWAWLCGVRHFELIGVDYAEPRPLEWIKGYGFPQSRAGRYDSNPPASIERQFAALREGIGAGGGTIVNLSAGSRLKAIPNAGSAGSDAGSVEQAGGAVEGHPRGAAKRRGRRARHSAHVANHEPSH